MARPLSEEKRDAILSSAAELVATMGTGAPTAQIAKKAGLSEGTLFTYFATKDELLSELFLSIEADLASSMLEAVPASLGPRERVRHLWDRYIDWGAQNSLKRKAIRQLKVSDRITREVKRKGEALFQDIKTLLDQSLAGHVKKGQDRAYISATFDALADMTLGLIANSPKEIEHYKRSGFEVFWKGIGR